MKSLLFVIPFLIMSFSSFSQEQETTEDNSWEKVILTTNTDDVKGMERIGEVNETTTIPYGRQSKLREKTREKVKKSAHLLGGTVVLIQTDNFSMTPLNNVNIIGVAYKPKKDSEISSENQ